MPQPGDAGLRVVPKLGAVDRHRLTRHAQSGRDLHALRCLAGEADPGLILLPVDDPAGGGEQCLLVVGEVAEPSQLARAKRAMPDETQLRIEQVEIGALDNM